jgi:hypothetical protein
MEYTVETKFNKETIKQGTILMDDGKTISTIASNIIRLEEQGVRDALIKLGWTPPTEIKKGDK